MDEKRNGEHGKPTKKGKLTEMHLLEHHFVMREERDNNYNSEAETKSPDLVIVPCCWDQFCHLVHCENP